MNILLCDFTGAFDGIGGLGLIGTLIVIMAGGLGVWLGVKVACLGFRWWVDAGLSHLSR